MKQLNEIVMRSLTPTDESILWVMLQYAAHEPSIASVQQQPLLVRYAAAWGREGDLGCAAFNGDRAIGAAWVRLWTGDDRGFGYLAPDIPELAMAVVPNDRGRGIGTILLENLLLLAQAQFRAVSLNVRSDNPVVRLYERHRFIKVLGSEMTNRVGGISYNMVCRFE